MLVGYGDGTFMTQTTYSTKNGSKPCSLAYGGFNNDSMLDIAVANTGTNNVEVFSGHGNEIFSNLTTYSTED
ncbi:unnamed protein product, partial [Rotaria magnacalcarata]